VERLDDEDHMVRAAAATALADCSALDVRDALLAALGDRSHSVQSAARESLRSMGVEVAGDAQLSAEEIR
jgi:HEAT repeat protein